MAGLPITFRAPRKRLGLAPAAWGVVALVLLASPAAAQTGGRHAFTFLQRSFSPRVTALGGYSPAWPGRDLSVALAYPYALGGSVDYPRKTDSTPEIWMDGEVPPADAQGRALANVASFAGGSQHGAAAYARPFGQVGTGMASVRFVNHGTFRRTDDAGNDLGLVGANDIALGAAFGRAFGERILAGAAFNLIYSDVAGFGSWGISTDWSAAYVNPKQGWSVGVALLNLGGQLKPYWGGGATASLPLDLRVVGTVHIPYTPFRVTLTAHSLNDPDLTSTNPNLPTPVDLNGNPIDVSPSAADKVFRHLAFGLEMRLSRNFHARLGYDHQQRADQPGGASGFSLSGVSMGVGLRINKFYIDYGFMSLGDLGSVHHIGLQTAVADWMPQAKPRPAPKPAALD